VILPKHPGSFALEGWRSLAKCMWKTEDGDGSASQRAFARVSRKPTLRLRRHSYISSKVGLSHMAQSLERIRTVGVRVDLGRGTFDPVTPNADGRGVG
jgi:hypothetical protein